MSKKVLIDKSDLYEYYINQNHTLVETAAYFNTSRTTIKNTNRHFGIKKGINISRITQTKLEKQQQSIHWSDFFTKVDEGGFMTLDEPARGTVMSAYSRLMKCGAPFVRLCWDNGVVKASYICHACGKEILVQYQNIVRRYNPNQKHMAHLTCSECARHKKFSQESLMKTKQTNLKRWGVDNYTKTKAYKDLYKNKNFNEHHYKTGLRTKIEKGCVGTSAGEKELRAFVETLGYTTTKHVIKHPTTSKVFEIDVFIPEIKCGIEYNGVYFHAVNGKLKRRTYHQTKTKAAEANGIHLMYVWEDEWLSNKDLIKDRIKEFIVDPPTKVLFEEPRRFLISKTRPFIRYDRKPRNKDVFVCYDDGAVFGSI